MSGIISAIYGASGFGKEVLPLARNQNPSEELYFIDDNLAGRSILGTRVLKYEEFLSLNAKEKRVAIAIANSSVREQLTKKCMADGIQLWNIQAANTVVLDAVSIGPGHILCPFVTLTSDIQIGKGFHANIYSYVAHECQIGDFVTFAPAVKCNGNVVVEDHAYIGTGAIIKQGTPARPLVIGRGAVIGMGAVVTKSVPPGTVVIGNPAKPLTKDTLKQS